MHLTTTALTRKSNLVLSTNVNFYAQWRRRGMPELREEAGRPSERLLQAVWFHQRILRENLRTTDGRPVQVLHPGFWNHEAGPDFREALLRIGDDAPAQGDVEVDLRSAGWRDHGHDTNPNFRNVRLHVVWDRDQPVEIPTVVLRDLLDSPVNELTTWLGSDSADHFPENLLGNCCAPLREIGAERRHELLQQAGLVRLQSKAAQFRSRARQAGTDQSLWEGLLRALGYKNNVWPMQRLGELRDRLLQGEKAPDLVQIQARVMGVAGLLPQELSRAQKAAAGYVRKLWDHWWRERDSFADCVLPRAAWRFNNLRPANHPERRLALAAHWLSDRQLPQRLEKWCAKEVPTRNLLDSLVKAFWVEKDDFWSFHFTLKSKPLAKAQPMIGPTRVTDLAINVVLPWLWMRAAEGKNSAMQERIEERYRAWPPAEDNAVLRLARNRLLGGAAARELKGAAVQQGLLQIVRDFCQQSNAICDQCRFPELVREWKI